MEFQESPGRPYRIAPAALTPEQSALLDRILKGPRKSVPPNLLVWLHNIEFADVAERFGAYVSQLAPFTPRGKEIIILVVASYWRSKFEWHFHAKMGLDKGLTQAQIDALWDKRDPLFTDVREQVTYELAFALNEQRDVPAGLFERAMTTLGHKGISDLIGLMGLYTMIAHTINVYRLPIPQDGA